MSLIQTVVGAIIALLVGLGSFMYFGKTDNPVEEACDRVIEKELGLPEGSVDLAPAEKDSKPTEV